MLNKRISTTVLALSLLAIPLTLTITPTTSFASEKVATINDISGHWAEEQLDFFYKKGMLTAYDGNLLKPDKTVTRAEFVTFTNRVLNFTDPSDEITFKDVPSDAWYANEVSKAIQAGYISTSAENFRPNDAITREEAAVILTNIFDNKDTNLDKILEFKDSDKISEWAKPSMEGAIEAGYILGTTNKELKPANKLNRAEMAAIFYRIDKTPVDIESHFAEKELDFFYKKGMLTIYEGNLLKPNKSVTRAEFIAFTNRVLGFDRITPDSNSVFKDVPSDAWFAKEVSRAVKVGYISTSSENFRPNDNITRQEAAVVLTNIFNNKDTNLNSLSKFKDGDKVAEWAKSSMEGAIEMGYIIGDTNKNLNPTKSVTRGEMALMLYRTNH